MFIFKKKSTNEFFLWSNSKKDDFIRYIPKNLETTKNDIDIYLLPDKFKDDDINFHNLIKEEPPKVEVYEEYSEDTGFSKLLDTFISKKIDYPYNENDEYIEPTY